MDYELLFEEVDDIINEFIYEGLYEAVGTDEQAVDKKKETLIHRFIEWVKKMCRMIYNKFNNFVDKIIAYFRTKKFIEGEVKEDTTILSEVMHGIPKQICSFMHKNIVNQVKDDDSYDVYMTDVKNALSDKSLNVKKGTKVSVNMLIRHLSNTRLEIRKIFDKMNELDKTIPTKSITDEVLIRAKNVLNIFFKYLDNIEKSAYDFIYLKVDFSTYKISITGKTPMFTNNETNDNMSRESVNKVKKIIDLVYGGKIDYEQTKKMLDEISKRYKHPFLLARPHPISKQYWNKQYLKKLYEECKNECFSKSCILYMATVADEIYGKKHKRAYKLIY